MATTKETTTKPATDKVKKAPPTAVQRVSDILKRSALQGKVSADELDVVAALANSLKVFIKAP